MLDQFEMYMYGTVPMPATAQVRTSNLCTQTAALLQSTQYMRGCYSPQHGCVFAPCSDSASARVCGDDLLQVWKMGSQDISTRAEQHVAVQELRYIAMTDKFALDRQIGQTPGCLQMYAIDVLAMHHCCVTTHAAPVCAAKPM